MDVSAARPCSCAANTAPAVIWHDLECGAYRADLPLWRELAGGAGGPVLDVGAGTGRVALALARAGSPVTGLEREEVLLDALRERAAAAGLPVQAVQGDARSFALAGADYALCLVPMQTVQLLGGAAGRAAFLRRAREHLREGGLLACAILGTLEPFDCSDGGLGPAPENTTRDGLRYVSRAIRVSETSEHVTIERERVILPEHAPPPAWPFPRSRIARATMATDGATSTPDGATHELDVIVLDTLSAATLQREGEAAGFAALAPREIAATDEHVASGVVMFGA